MLRPSAAQRVRINSEPSYLTRLGVVYAHPIRLKIVTELYMREMSATQFWEKFDTPPRNVVHWHFRQLAIHGWIRKIRSGKTQPGRGRPQNFYRATELAVIDCETWNQLPLSIRSALSLRVLEQLAERLQSAIEGNTLDSRVDRHLTWTPVVLDEDSLLEQMKAMSDCFWDVLQEQADAKLRLRKAHEQPILMTVALAGFESPLPAAVNDASRSVNGALTNTAQDHVPNLVRLAKVFADPLSLKIVSELNLASLSPSQLAERFGGPSIFAIDRRCKVLTDLGWLSKVDEKTGGPRRGATENFYRAVGPAVFDVEDWSGISASEKHDASAVTIRQFWERVAEAVGAGTFDSKLERHLSWCSLLVDQQGWDRVMKRLYRYFEELMALREASVQCPGGPRSAGTFFLAGFESPEPPTAAQLALH